MFEAFEDWLILGLPANRYTIQAGEWVEDASRDALWFAVIDGNGGPPVDVETRRKRYRVLLLGPRNNRSAAAQLEQDIEALVSFALDIEVPCGAAGVRVMTEPVGPGYTTEDRAWFSVEFQILF